MNCDLGSGDGAVVPGGTGFHVRGRPGTATSGSWDDETFFGGRRGAALSAQSRVDSGSLEPVGVAQ